MTSHELDCLIKRYLLGDISAFDDIYYETYKSVYLSIYIFFKDSSTIEDLMQDTYMKAIDNMQSYKLGTNFKAWISKIARNISINYFNKKKRVEIYEITDNVFQCVDSSPKLKYYINFLEGNERDIVIYHIILDMKFKEIGDVLDLPTSSVFAIYKRALEKIRKEI